MKTEKFTIAKYLRISDEDKDKEELEKEESNSIVNQRNLIADFIERTPEFEKASVLEFCDDGFSGRNFERPAVQEMLAKVRRGEIQCIVVKDLSRFGRDYLAVGNYLSRVFPFLGVRFIAVNDGFDSGRQGDVDGLDTSFKLLLHDLYSRDLSRKVQSAQRQRARRGEFLSSFAPFGYVKDKENKKKLAVDPAAAEIVRRIFHMTAEGLSTARIAQTLNKEGIPTPMGYKREMGCSRKIWGNAHENQFWTQNAVMKILRDERYIGNIVYGKRRQDGAGSLHAHKAAREEWIVVENTHEGLIAKAEFDRVQEQISKRARSGRAQGGKSCSDTSGSAQGDMPPKLHAGRTTDGENSILCLTERRSNRTFSAVRPALHPADTESPSPRSIKKVRCGICGYAMTRMKTKEPYYYCQTPRVTDKYFCPTERIPEQDLKRAAFVDLRMRAAYRADISRIWEEKLYIKRQKAAEEEKKLAELKSILRETDNDTRRLYEQFALGELKKEEYLIKKEALVKKKENLLIKMQEAQEGLEGIGGKERRGEKGRGKEKRGENGSGEEKSEEKRGREEQRGTEWKGIEKEGEERSGKEKSGEERKGNSAGDARQHDRAGELTAEMAAELLQEIIIYPDRKLNIVWNFKEEVLG
ncbi:MAG: recombinase family protein [Clostridium sp.]|nr:recombinase family protein [Clostridium sp.]